MKKMTVKLEYNSLIALLQGKELHVCNGEVDFVFLSPLDGVFMTHEQLAQMRLQDQNQLLGLLKDIEVHEQKEK